MPRPSPRDLLLVGGLLPLLAREITADPEQYDRARREARIKGVKELTNYVKHTRIEAEKKRDDELRANLNRGKLAGPSRRSGHRVVQPIVETVQPAIGSEHRTGPSVPKSFAPTANLAVSTQQRTTDSSSNIIKSTTVSARSLHSSLLVPATTHSLGSYTSNRTLPETSVLVSPKPHASEDVNSKCPGSGSPANQFPDPRNDSVLVKQLNRIMGAQQSRAHAGHERSLSKHPAKGPESVSPSGGPSLQGDIAFAEVAAVKDVSTSFKPTVAAKSGDSGTAYEPCKALEDLHRSLDEKPHGLLHRRDFEVKRILKRVLSEGKPKYKVRWKSTWVQVDAIVEGYGQECSYVKADGAEWYIRRMLGSRTVDGVQQRKVRWISTKEPPENLANAQEAIDNFERIKQQAGLDDAHRVRQSDVLTIRESKFPHGRIQAQTEEDYTAAQRWVAHTWPMVRPHKTLDLYPAIYQILLELSGSNLEASHGGKSYRSLMKQPQLRPLRWSEAFIKLGKPFNCGRRRRAALLLQVTGELDTSGPCTRCLGDKLAPFIGCVRSSLSQQSWLGGACANCGTQDNGTCPHHRKSRLHPTIHAQLSTASHAGHHHQGHGLSNMQGTFDTDDDADDSDSDEDEESDDDEGDDENDDGQDQDNNGLLVTPSSPTTARKDQYSREAKSASKSKGTSPTHVDTEGSPAIPPRPGKLQKINKIKTQSAPTVAGPAFTPPTPPTTQPSQAPNSSKVTHQPGDISANPAIESPGQGGASARLRHRSFAAIAADNTQLESNYTPDPIELDVLELLWKHLTPVPSIEHGHPDTENLSGITKQMPAIVAQTAGINSLPYLSDPSQNGNERSVDGGPDPQSSPPSLDDRGRKLAKANGKRRAGSLLPRSKRASRRSFDHTSGNLPELSTSRQDTPAAELPAKTFLNIRSRDMIARYSTHRGCIEGEPCHDYQGASPMTGNPLIAVYHNTIYIGREITVAEAEFVLSRCDCYWAWKFTAIWARWCLEKGGIENEERSQVEFLLSFPDLLREAAQDCCPRGQPELIVIDDN